MANPPTVSGITGKSAMSSIFRGDVALAAGIVIILMFMLVPMPPALVDIGLSISITFSVMILMITLFIRRPLEFSTFPTILLITTALRLGLNLASTRLILSDGDTGTDAAGRIIEAFGTFMIRGNYVVGGIVFAILVIVNFIVITKGSGRIAEVAARFSLDAMPGKQMAIDSDLSSGIITEEEAKKKRSELQQESTFFGAMDGAAKFVRGDAIAGLLVTFINLLGGIIIGTASKDLSLSEAANVYSLLTIGDGLVSQIPALIVSVAAGLLVAKAGVEVSADEALIDQFGRYPRATAMTSGLILAIGFIPGMPLLPFVALAGVSLGISYFSFKRQRLQAEAKTQLQEDEAIAARPAEDPISRSLAMDTIRLELGYALLPLVQGGENSVKLPDQIKGLRRQLAEEMGYILPSVRIQDNLQLPAGTYVVRIKEIESGRGEVRPGMLLCMDPTGESISLPGENTVEPTFGLPAMWVDQRYREEAHFKGYTVVDAATVITTHLTEVIKDNMADLLSYTETQRLLDELPKDYQKLVGDVIPSQISVGGLQRVLQNLVNERISIRDLATILEGVAEATTYTKNVMMITEHVRSRLSRQICEQNLNVHGHVPLITLSPKWEQAFAEALIGDRGDERQLAMAPSVLQDFIVAVRTTFDKFAQTGESPVLLTSPLIRPYVRSVIERFRPQTSVMSQNEIHAKAKIKTVGQV
ncbi:MAG: flagellar biosynthesis protein FlhA [Alphaproteobacteria bacterium]|nr:flagellar biosynthesis protein FlhA [Alphaproteobacteria bacterium]